MACGAVQHVLRPPRAGPPSPARARVMLVYTLKIARVQFLLPGAAEDAVLGAQRAEALAAAAGVGAGVALHPEHILHRLIIGRADVTPSKHHHSNPHII